MSWCLRDLRMAVKGCTLHLLWWWVQLTMHKRGMNHSWTWFFCQNFVQFVEFRHCLLVLKGLYANCFDNVLMWNKTYFGTSLLHELICVWPRCSTGDLNEQPMKPCSNWMLFKTMNSLSICCDNFTYEAENWIIIGICITIRLSNSPIRLYVDLPGLWPPFTLLTKLVVCYCWEMCIHICFNKYVYINDTFKYY